MSNLVLHGAGKGGGGGGGKESDDTLFSTAYVEVIDVIGEGNIKGLVDGGRSIFLDDTPIVAKNGQRNHKVEWDIRTGWQNQEPFPAVHGVSAEINVAAQVQKDTPIVQTITDEDADFAVVTLGFPRMMHVNDKGDINGTRVEFKIEMQPYGEAYQNVASPITSAPGVFDGDNNYYASPAGTIRAICYLHSDTEDELVVERSTNGVDFTVYETVELSPASFVSGKSASITIDSASGSYYLRWPGAAGAYNSVTWSYYSGDPNRVTGKCGSRYQKQYRFRLTGSAPWQVRVTRLTDDSGSAKLSNDLYWDSLQTQIVARLNYPNSALMYYRIPAKEFSSVPRRKVEVFGTEIRVPTNYNPKTRAYSGIWDGSFKTAWTDNPAWHFYDIAVTERYGTGKYIKATGIDKWVLYEIGRYCDELVDSGLRDDEGGIIYEPRFTLNIQLAQPREAFQWLNDLVSVFRGMMYVIDGKLTAVADRPSDPMRLFNRTNVINGEFSFSGTAALARKTVALVHFKNPSNLYQDDVEYVPNRDLIKLYGIVPNEVVAVGCTSRGQAHRLGKWLLMEGEVVNFSVGHDAAFVMPGAIVQCAIPLRSNNTRTGGRLKSIDDLIVVLDAPVTLTMGHNYQLSVVLADGSISSRDVIAIATETTDTLTIASTFTGEIVERALWVLIDWDGVKPTLWRVLSMPDGDGVTRKITAVSHDPDKFDRIDTFNAPIDASLLPARNPLLIDAPSTVTIENKPFADKNGIVQNKLHVHWAQVIDAVSYKVRWRLNDGNWNSVPALIGTLWEMIIKDDGDYTVEVVAVSVLGKLSAPAQAMATIIGDSIFMFNQDITLDVSSDGTFPTVVSRLTLTAGIYDLVALFGTGDPDHTATLTLEDETGTAITTLTSDGGIHEVSTSTAFEITETVDLDIVIYGSDVESVTVLKKIRVVKV